MIASALRSEPPKVICGKTIDVLSSLLFSDSVEEGEKLVKTALDAFGRIGEVSWLLWFL